MLQLNATCVSAYLLPDEMVWGGVVYLSCLLREHLHCYRLRGEHNTASGTSKRIKRLVLGIHDEQSSLSTNHKFGF